MKNVFWSMVLILACSTQVFAGDRGSGGGDECKNEIDKDRATILGWIQNDDASGLDFSKAHVSGLTYDLYKQKMTAVLQPGKVIVTCFLDRAKDDPSAVKISKDKGVSFKAITIGSPPEPVTCINYEDAKGVSHIDCNYDLIMNASSVGNPDYVTTHHEFASIAGIEARTNSYISDFSISNQVSQFEHLESRWVLGPKTTSACPSCTVDSQTTKLIPEGTTVKGYILVSQLPSENIQFQVCNGAKVCSVIGKPDGYSQAQLADRYKQLITRTEATTIGAGASLVALAGVGMMGGMVATMSTAFNYILGGTAIGGFIASNPIGMMVIGSAVGSAIDLTVTKIVHSINPLYNYDSAKSLEEVQNWLASGNTVVMNSSLETVANEMSYALNGIK